MKMSLRTKLMSAGTGLAVVPALLLSWLLSTSAVDQGAAALQQAAAQKLTATRDATARHVEDYLQTIQDQVLTFAADLMVQDALAAFSAGFSNYSQPLSPAQLQQQQAAVSQYYQQAFGQRFAELNGGQQAPTDQLFSRTAELSSALQYSYIAANPAPLGKKDQLTSPQSARPYDDAHRKFHPALHAYQQKFGYYDIFLIDAASGNVVYTVFKELDFATNLQTGPYKDTGLAAAYRLALQASGPGEFFMTDFAPYLPSYNAPAAFIATPVFQGTKLVGVLAFQLPADRLNAVMTHQRQWQQTGFGSSGETYLAGQDLRMRSDARGLI